MLAEKYRDQINSILARYPAAQKRSAVMPLLYLAQSEYGHVTPAALSEVGALTNLSATEVAGIVGFYTLYHDHAAGKRYLQICTDLPCALRGAEAFAGALCDKLGVKPNGTTKDGEWTVEYVMCLAACDHAPMFQVQDATGIHYHQSETIDKPMSVDDAVAVLNGYQQSGKSS